MTPEYQTKLVQDICNAVRDSVLADVAAGKVPSTWDGHELRVLLVDRFRVNAAATCLVRNPRGARARAYKNHIQTTTL